MRTNKAIWAVAVVLVVAATLLSACGGGGQADFDGEALLQERCTECHGLDRVTGAEKTRAQWEQTVSEMVDMGAVLSAEEQVALVDYLAENYGP